MFKTIKNYLYAALLILILAIAWSIPELIYPEYGQIDYTGLTEVKHEAYLRCLDIKSHLETINKIENQ